VSLDAEARAYRMRLYHRKRWRNLRLQQLGMHPTCAHCGMRAEVVDHRSGHAGDWLSRFYDPSNLQSLCHPCHNAKTVRETGTAFGPTRSRRGGGQGGDGQAEIEGHWTARKGDTAKKSDFQKGGKIRILAEILIRNRL
jgi:hypothetical protein